MKITEDEDLALKGMRRAAVIARERAARFGLQIPVWRDGAIVFVNPKVKEQADSGAHSNSAPDAPPSAPSE
jgi:hypothetical protein